ncbi:MAG: ABC transporter permease subunit/CPBP intramembrane protease [Planctomycetales bacterium]
MSQSVQTPVSQTAERRNAGGQLYRLTLKECRETLRDRRTILTLLMMPILVYPLLTIGFQKFLLNEAATRKQEEVQIGVANQAEFNVIRNTLAFGERNFPPTRSGIDFPLRPDKPPSKATFFEGSTLSEAVRSGRVDIGIRMPEGQTVPNLEDGKDVSLNLELLVVKGTALGEQALAFVEKRIDSANRAILQQRFRELGITQRVRPVDTTLQILEPIETRSAGFMTFSALIPVVLILMTMTGGVYPAIDLTAGERERGTLEMLIAAPVSRYKLLFAKFVAVVLVSMLTALVNLVSMTVTLQATGLGSILWGDKGLSAVVVVEVFLLLILFSGFFAALLLSLTSFARSFKEAQAYLIPLMMLSLSPGFVSLLPGLQLRGWLLIVPLLNMSLLTRDLLQGAAVPSSTFIVVVFTALSALGALSLAARLFGSEGVLYASESGWGDFLRKPQKSSPAISLSGAMLTLACLFPLQFVCVNLLAQVREYSLSIRLTLMAVCTLLLFVGVALVSATWGNVRKRSGFAWQGFTPLQGIGAVLLGLSLWPFALELTLLMRQLGLVSVNPEQFSGVKKLLEHAQSIPLPVLLFSFALVPGFSEEIFFRGFLQRSFLQRMKPLAAIGLSSVLFGMFHLVAQEGLAFERLLPSTCLGLVLGWLCWSTRSLFPGMLMHITHNGVLMSLAYFEPQLRAAGWGTEEGEHLPVTWLLSAGMVAAVGFALLAVSLRRQGRSVLAVET